MNTPAYAPNLTDEMDFITVNFLPPDITPLISQVISNFKKLYIKALFKRFVGNLS